MKKKLSFILFILAIALVFPKMIMDINIIYCEEASFGDVNSDGSIDSSDALMVLKYAARLLELSEENKLSAEVIGNDSIDAEDALGILKYASKIIDEFPIVKLLSSDKNTDDKIAISTETLEETPGITSSLFVGDLNGAQSGKVVSANVGDEVEFTIKANVPNMFGSENIFKYTIYNELSPGIDINIDSLSVTIDDIELNLEEYEFFNDNSGFGVNIKNLSNYTTGAEIVVKVNGSVNQSALLNDKITSKATRIYLYNPGELESINEVSCNNYIYDTDIVINNYDSADSSKKLAGGKFVLKNGRLSLYYSLDPITNEVSWVDLDEATVLTTNDNGSAIFTGLAADTYYLIEVEAPEGYLIEKQTTVVDVYLNCSDWDNHKKMGEDYAVMQKDAETAQYYTVADVANKSDGTIAFPPTVNTSPDKIIDGGVYSLYNEESGCYLSYDGTSLTLSNTARHWNCQSFYDAGFYIYAKGTELMFDIPNADIFEGNIINLRTHSGYMAQVWNINRNENGTYSIISALDSAYCIGLNDGNANLQLRDESNPTQEWIVTEITGEAKLGYRKFLSSNGIIELQLPLDINKVISDEQLQIWANKLERAYYSYGELTNFFPYDKIFIKAYIPTEFIGYVVNDSNIIHIDRGFIYEDLAKMAAREDDWNFCALHEMGHMFDCRRPWTFEAELMTDLKVAYVLEANNAAAAPSEFAASDYFYGKDIKSAYEILGSDFSTSYNIFGCTARFLEIKEDIGWGPFKQTFYYLQKNAAVYSDASRQEMFENFIKLLSQYSGTNIKSYFSASEWDTIIQITQE